MSILKPMTEPAGQVLLYFVVPLWLCAGVADWFCHRAAHIESTTGVKESLIHLLMFAEVGLALLAGIFLEINAGIILLMILIFLMHEATALWDVSYAVTARRVGPFEQHVHSFLELIPLMAILCVVLLHWRQFLSLLGMDPEPARFTLSLKSEKLPTSYVSTLFSAILLFEVLPYVEELRRGMKTKAHWGARLA
jgi:hypothetical protein